MTTTNQHKKILNRIYHPWWKWECYKNGFYKTLPPDGVEKDRAKELYAEFLSDTKLFSEHIYQVFTDWPHSCEHFLTNPSINRIAWIGQSSMCHYSGIPSAYRSGFQILSEQQQSEANTCAAYFLDMWEAGIGS